MTSKELVEVINAIRKEEGNDVEIQHNNLMQRIRGFEQILGALAVQQAEYLDTQGKPRPMLLLSKRASMLAVSSESPRVHLAIIDRWQELEIQQQQALPQTHIEAVRAYLVTLETVEAQSKQLGIQAEVIQKQTVVIDHKKIRTDDSMTHTTMVRVRKLNPNETFSSARLIAYCEDNEINIEKVYDAHDQPVNSYPNAAWEAIYPDVVLPAHL